MKFHKAYVPVSNHYILLYFHIYLTDKPAVTLLCKWFCVPVTPQTTLLCQLVNSIYNFHYY